MIKFVICDDNKREIDIANNTIIKAMINYDIEYKIEKFTKYCDELVKIINDDTDMKIYLLDIELPTQSGLEIASEIREIDSHSYIIFVTSHPECQNDIFFSRLGAIDYISKCNRYEERIEETIKYIMTKTYQNKVLSFTNNYVYTKLRYKEINYIAKAPLQNKCIIHVVEGEPKQIMTSIVKLKKELEPLFFQSHKSCLVNLENIKTIDYKNYTIYFKNGDYTMLLTPSGRKELRQIVGEF